MRASVCVRNHLTLLILLSCLGHLSESLSAQEAVAPSPTITPSVGMGGILDNGDLESGGMSVLLEIDLSQSRLRWSLFGEVRGIGVGCADGCDLSGQTIGAGVSYLLGRVGVGGGVGFLHRSAGWNLQPHGQLSVALGVFRTQLRLEASEGTGGMHVPLLFGLQLPVG